MNPIRVCLATALALSLAACTILPKQASVTTLLLPLADTPLSTPWPEGVSPGRVSAAAALQSERVLVLSGARLMQAPELAWAAPPGTLVAEQVARLSAQATTTAAPSARLDVMLDAFWWEAASSEVRVRAHGTMRCADGRSVSLPETSATESLASIDDAEAVAAAFATASRDVIATLLAGSAATKCH